MNWKLLRNKVLLLLEMLVEICRAILCRRQNGWKVALDGNKLPCIRKDLLKFKLTNQNSASGKTVLSEATSLPCILIG